MTPQDIATELASWKPVQDAGKPTPLGSALLALTDADLVPLLAQVGRTNSGRFYGGDRGILDLLVAHAPERVRPVFDSPELAFSLHLFSVAAWLLKFDLDHFAPKLAALSDDATVSAEDRLSLKFELARADPSRTAVAIAAIREFGVTNTSRRSAILSWLSREAGPEGIPLLAELMTKPEKSWWGERNVIVDAVRRFKQAALPVVRAALAHAPEQFRPFLIRQLIDLADPADEPLIEHTLGELLVRTKDKELADYIELAGSWKVEKIAEKLWPLLEHSSKPVRREAAETLAVLGEPALERGKTMLVAKKPDHRGTGVDLLGALGSPEALAALEARVDVEENDDVRDAILKRLASAWRAAGRHLTRADLDARAAKPVKLPHSLRDVQYSTLPPLHFPDGGTWTPDQVRWLIGRAARSKAGELDIEAEMALPLIDRKRAGDFALALLDTKYPAWLFALAAVLGDDRTVHAMHSQIRQLADGTGHKTAEGAVGYLALNGSDMALLAVDALSRRYASKKKHVGEAAGRAFAAAATRLGLSVDELGDRVVPSLGFEPGRPRLVKSDDKEFEARVGMDWKLKFVDTAKRKPVAALPKSVGAEVLKEFKEVAASLREVSKAQVARLENLLVRQQRWPAAQWQSLYTRHPLLVPFAVRLVWGDYGPTGELRQTFRALEDGTLTGPEDTVTLPADALVGLVHPLDLSAEAKAAWLEHMEDYKVIPPFEQLERPVVRVSAEHAKDVFARDHAGHTMNALTIRGRLERWGWGHTARGDHGHLCAFFKRFGTAGVDAVVRLEDGIMVYAGPDESATLAEFFFLRGGAVDFSSASFEGSPKATDERLVPLGEVPAVAYSETAGEMQRLTAK